MKGWSQTMQKSNIQKYQSSCIWICFYFMAIAVKIIVPIEVMHHGPVTIYVTLLVVHTLGMKGTFSPPPTSKETASCIHHVMHHGMCATHVSWFISGSLTRDGRENVPGIPGACTARDLTYLARDTLSGVAILLFMRSRVTSSLDCIDDEKLKRRIRP